MSLTFGQLKVTGFGEFEQAVQILVYEWPPIYQREAEHIRSLAERKDPFVRRSPEPLTDEASE